MFAKLGLQTVELKVESIAKFVVHQKSDSFRKKIINLGYVKN